MKETIYFMVLVSIGSLGLFLAWKRTGNYDVDFFIKIIVNRPIIEESIDMCAQYKVKISEENILSKIKDREEAKKAGNYKLADQIRNDLNKEGIDIKDEKGKTTWNYK